jgi:hypothetical protein
MNRVKKARRFAELAYATAVAEIDEEYSLKRRAMRERIGNVDPAAFSRSDEEAKLEAEQTVATIKAQLSALLDGYELNDVPVDDGVAATIFSEVSRALDAAIGLHDLGPTRPVSGAEMNSIWYRRQVIRHIKSSISSHWIQTKIDGAGLIRKPHATPIASSDVDDDSPRVGVATGGNSARTLIESNGQLFATIRQKIEFCLEDGYEKTRMLEALEALRRAQEAQSLARRYEDFISATANHILLLRPFLAGLIEMVHKALRCDERLRA